MIRLDVHSWMGHGKENPTFSSKNREAENNNYDFPGAVISEIRKCIILTFKLRTPSYTFIETEYCLELKPRDVMKNWWEALSGSVAVNESRTKAQELQEQKG